MGSRSSPGRRRRTRRRARRRTAASRRRPRRPRAAASGSRRSAPDRPIRTRGRPPGRRRGTRSGTRCSGCSGEPGGRPRRRACARARCRAARGGTRAAHRRPPFRSTATCTGSSAPPSTSAAAAGGTPPCRATTGTTFSTPITVTSTSGSVVHMRPLPSDSTTQMLPVSATPKFAPLTPIRADRNFARRCSRAASASAAGSSVRSSSPSSRRKMSRISARLRWIAGTRMCEGKSSSSWMISSARSVSTARTPAAASCSFSEISSVAIDLTFTTSSSPCDRAMSATIAHASSPSRAQCTRPPAEVTCDSSSSS